MQALYLCRAKCSKKTLPVATPSPHLVQYLLLIFKWIESGKRQDMSLGVLAANGVSVNGKPFASKAKTGGSIPSTLAQCPYISVGRACPGMPYNTATLQQSAPARPQLVHRLHISNRNSDA